MEREFTLENSDDIVFTALVLWREARGEPTVGKVAVVHSILNRVHRPKWWGKTLMEVLFKRLQYSSVTDPNDKQLVIWPVKNPLWEECKTISYDVIYGKLANPVPGADSYHDISIPSPYWAESKMFVKQIGRLKFYNVDLDYEKREICEEYEK